MQSMDRALYDRKVIYLDYLERDEKIKNGGVVKWEVRGDKSRLQFHIRGLYTTDTLEGEIRILSDGQTYVADHIRLKFGAGEALLYWDNDNLAGSGIPYEMCEEIEIVISQTRKLSGKVHEHIPKRVTREEIHEIGQDVAEKEMTQDIENVQPPEYRSPGFESPEPKKWEPEPEPEFSPIEPVMPEIEPNPIEPKMPEIEPSPTEPVMPEPDTSPTEPEPPEILPPNPEPPEPADVMLSQVQEKAAPKRKGPTMVPRFSTDKWEQLCRYYKKIIPFGDDRDYLSIEPRDFVILCGKYQELVQNSFLLHGYYNYGHVILTRIKGEEDKYYIGVPGVYYEKEKQAALLFGFEGFEGGSENLREGAFGYYMKRVEI